MDSFYAVQPDMHNHSGITMTLGKGVAYPTLYKQKIHTKCTYHDNLTGKQEYYNICRKWHYVELQVNKNLNIQYFFVTDKIKIGEVKVPYCPMNNILGEFFMKRL